MKSSISCISEGFKSIFWVENFGRIIFISAKPALARI